MRQTQLKFPGVIVITYVHALFMISGYFSVGFQRPAFTKFCHVKMVVDMLRNFYWRCTPDIFHTPSAPGKKKFKELICVWATVISWPD